MSQSKNHGNSKLLDRISLPKVLSKSSLSLSVAVSSHEKSKSFDSSTLTINRLSKTTGKQEQFLKSLKLCLFSLLYSQLLFTLILALTFEARG